MLTSDEIQISENPNILLKKATLDDLDFINELSYHEMNAIVSRAWRGKFRWESWFKDIKEALTLDSHIIQLIQVKRENIGWLWMNTETNSLWITAIVLKLEWQRRKIGSQIMAHLINECKQDGIKTIELGVQQNNEAAMRFYTEIGFRKFDQIRSAGTDLLHLKLNDHRDLSYL